MKETDEISKWSLGENNKKATRVQNMSPLNNLDKPYNADVCLAINRHDQPNSTLSDSADIIKPLDQYLCIITETKWQGVQSDMGNYVKRDCCT